MHQFINHFNNKILHWSDRHKSFHFTEMTRTLWMDIYTFPYKYLISEHDSDSYNTKHLYIKWCEICKCLKAFLGLFYTLWSGIKLWTRTQTNITSTSLTSANCLLSTPNSIGTTSNLPELCSLWPVKQDSNPWRNKVQWNNPGMLDSS